MTVKRMAVVEGKLYSVTISDEQEALSAAYAAGGAIIGFWDRKRGEESLAPAEYVVESLEDIDDELLERVVRRRLRLPWVIAETKRLLIREFTPGDFPAASLEADGPGEEIFRSEETFAAYLACQYRFYEYGIWVLVEKGSGTVIGRAGLFAGERQQEGWEAMREEAERPEPDMKAGGRGNALQKKDDIPLELGYHIFSSWRRLGYGKEACEAILNYGASRLTEQICAVIDGENAASLRLARSLGFRPAARRYVLNRSDAKTATAGKCSESAGWQYLYVWNCS